MLYCSGIMPLIYHSLESEHSNVQERVLKAIPGLCDSLDYSTLQDILLVKVAVSSRLLKMPTIDV